MKTWKDWYIPLSQKDRNLGEAFDEMQLLGADQNKIPLIVQLVENPKYQHWLNPFKGTGAVNLENHDYIHILLGRGMLPLDEAFVIGFTMGSTDILTDFTRGLYLFVSQHFYPKHYQFNKEEKRVYMDAAHLGYISDATPLHTIDMKSLRHLTIGEARKQLNIEEELLYGYYHIEKKRYNNSIASQRLFD